MNSIRAIQKLNKQELEAGISPDASWHTDYRDTAFIYIGGLPFELSEGDIITIFSQYGEPVWVKLARDRETGKSRGFAWIKYEDQKSCDLAVDNLGGAEIMDRIIRVDHARYKPKDDEDMRDNTVGELDLDPGNASDGERKKRRKTASESESDEGRPLLPEEIELERLEDKLDEEDPMRDSMIKRQQEKVDAAVQKMKKQKRKEKDRERRRDKHRHRDRSSDRHRHRERRIKEDEEDEQDRGPRRRDHRSRSRDVPSRYWNSRLQDGSEARPRITEEDEEQDRPSRRRDHRSRSRDAHLKDDIRRRKPRPRDDSEDRSHRHHSDRTRDRSEDHKDKHRRRERRRSSSDEGHRKRSRSRDSPLPYRARSPR